MPKLKLLKETLQENPIIHYQLMLLMGGSLFIIGPILMLYPDPFYDLGRKSLLAGVICTPVFAFIYKIRISLPDKNKSEIQSRYFPSLGLNALLVIFVGVPAMILAICSFKLGFIVSGYTFILTQIVTIQPGVQLKYKFIGSIALLLISFFIGYYEYS